MEEVGIFLAIWYILRTFGIFVSHFDLFSRFGMLHQDKSGNPILDTMAKKGNIMYNIKTHFFLLVIFCRPSLLHLKLRMATAQKLSTYLCMYIRRKTIHCFFSPGGAVQYISRCLIHLVLTAC
jgi:hypothetical protein